MLMSTLIAGLLISKDEGKRPQRDENSPEIPLGFPCLTATFSPIPRLPDTEMPQQLVEFFFARGKHILSQKYAFYKTYPMLTSDMRLVICTCDLQVELL